MSDYPALDRFLRTDPRDVGCDQALAVLDLYVELILAGPAEPAGGTGATRERYPGVTAHLLACGPCHDDYQGLLIAAGSTRGP